MGLLIDRINVREKAKYEQNTIKVLNNVVKPITTREYLVPNNAKSSAVYFWQNVLLIPPVRDGHTFPLTFIPSDNQNIIVKARFSHHPSGPLDNWTKYEAMGSPNKRVDIYFFSADDSDDPNGDVEAHVISNKHLYSDSDVKLLQQALANFFKSGNFVNPFCENNENNNTKQINCNTNMNKKLIRLTEGDLHRIVKRSVNRIISELNRSMIQSAYDKMIQQGRRGQAASMNDTFNDMYNGYDSEGNFVNQTDLSGKGRHYFLNHSDKGESTISNSESTYGDETSKYNPNIADSYLGKRNDALAQKAQQIQDWQYGKDGSTPYRTNSNMTPSYMRDANQEWRKKERAQRIGK